MLHIRRRVRFFFSAMAACLTLSWRTSPTYTVLRLTSNLVPPILTLVSSVLGKYVLDLLSGSFGQDNQIALLIMLSVGICISAIGVSAIQKAQTYMQSMHDELINKELALFMMDRAGTADLEYFDNAEYYDKLTACTRDAPMIAFLLNCNWQARMQEEYLRFDIAPTTMCNFSCTYCFEKGIKGEIMSAAICDDVSSFIIEKGKNAK